MPLTTASFSRHARFPAGDRILAHASEELGAHLARTGADGRVSVELTAGGGPGDGFEVRAGSDAVVLHGESSRGALNAVYWLLEQLGYLWVRPGEAGARFVPASLPEGTYRQSPAFPRRTLILGSDALHDDWREWLDFASRNRFNSVFFHDTPPSVLDRSGASRPADAESIAADGKGWLFERWDADGKAIRDAAETRGIALQFGGHHLPALLRRELFGEHPEWFPVRNGQRDARYNLCTSSAGAVAEVRSRAREFFQRFSGAAVYHLWADDILGGGWCGCPACAPLSPSDQALRATNVVAEALASVAPGAMIAHLAYHDTIAPPRAFRPAANVTALYAPRNRDYAFSIGDPQCERNANHFSELAGLAETFTGRDGALAVFEYYSDAILYKWLDPPHLTVLPEDAAAYRSAGVFDFGDLAVTPRPWVGPTWHAWWFARCAWERTPDREAELERFCAASFGSDGPVLAQLYRRLDQGYRRFLELGDLERIPRHDVLDFSDAPRAALGRKAAQMREALDIMNSAVRYLPLAPAGLGRDFREDLSVQLAAANHLGERVVAWEAALDGRTTEAAEHLALAQMSLSALRDWDHTHTTPAYANLSRNMLRAAGWHARRIGEIAGIPEEPHHQ